MDIEQIQQTLLEIYTKNIDYFKLHIPSLYNKIYQFESLNIENFYIDFKDNHFELLNKEHKAYYNCDPFYDANYRVNHISKDATFKLIDTELNNKHKVFYKDSLNANVQLKEYINLLNKQQNSIDINKMIFIGTLLGVHINDFHKNKKYNTYLIVEPNIEIFRLSLFLTDYVEILESSKVFFCIDYNKQEFDATIKHFIEYNYQYNSYIQFELISEDYIDLVNEINIQIAQNNQMTYPYSEYLVSMKRGYEYFKKSPNKILNITNITNLFENKPILYLGAGTSLAKELEWIYLNQDRFIIVASSAVLKRLELLAIVPDIIIVVDGQGATVINHFNVDKKLYKNTICFASIKIDNQLFELFDKDNIFFVQDSFELFEGYGILTGVTVGDVGINLLLQLGVKNLYLLGFDAALDPSSGRTHDSLHSSSKIIDLKTNNQNYTHHIVYIKGNFLDTVPTLPLYLGMKDNINQTVANTQANIFNLSNGAYFNNTTPLKTQNIQSQNLEYIDKSNLYNSLKNNLKSHCKKELSSLDKSYIKKELKIVQKLLKLNNKNFNQQFVKLQSQYKNSSILQIIYKYLLLFEPYVYITKNDTLKFKHLHEIYTFYNQVLLSVLD